MLCYNLLLLFSDILNKGNTLCIKLYNLKVQSKLDTVQIINIKLTFLPRNLDCFDRATKKKLFLMK